MNRIKLHDKYFVPFISNEKINAAIDAVAVKINNDFKNREDIPLLLCVLNGSIMFTGELMQRLDFLCELTSIRLSSYQGTQSTGVTKQIMGLSTDITGRCVIIIEDIVDTGHTIVDLQKLLIEAGAGEVKVCTMLLKPSVYRQNVKLDYVAMEIDNRFIVGYGLDYDQLGRNFKDIYVLE
ncbi:MAG: hypoxanthine phosphoribosyltransferase [Bacteroidales bacterium]|nr:hypoxanthine phosphoribosyltransferase [Bacteroidales bacterium]MDD3200506.1 hypoxanthine phosphoribosyltransferase [Bacteroidales bacterium]